MRRSGPATIGFFSETVLQKGGAEILAHMRQRVGHAVAVVLGGDHRQFFALVAVALEVTARDLAEEPGEAAADVGLFLAVAGPEQDVAHLGGGRRAHLLGAHDQRDAAAPGGDEVHGAM